MYWGLFPLYCSKKRPLCGSSASNRSSSVWIVERAPPAAGGVASQPCLGGKLPRETGCLGAGVSAAAPGLPGGPPAGDCERCPVFPEHSTIAALRRCQPQGLRAAVSVGRRLGRLAWERGHPAVGGARCLSLGPRVYETSVPPLGLDPHSPVASAPGGCASPDPP